MQRALIILTLLMILLCGCNSKEELSYKSNGVTVIKPTDNTVNGYRTEENKTVEDDFKDIESLDDIDYENRLETVYYVNTSSKKFHRPSCTSAAKINEENLYISDDRQELVESDYSPCGRCKP